MPCSAFSFSGRWSEPLNEQHFSLESIWATRPFRYAPIFHSSLFRQSACSRRICDPRINVFPITGAEDRGASIRCNLHRPIRVIVSPCSDARANFSSLSVIESHRRVCPSLGRFVPSQGISILTNHLGPQLRAVPLGTMKDDRFLVIGNREGPWFGRDFVSAFGIISSIRILTLCFQSAAPCPGKGSAKLFWRFRAHERQQSGLKTNEQDKKQSLQSQAGEMGSSLNSLTIEREG